MCTEQSSFLPSHQPLITCSTISEVRVACDTEGVSDALHVTVGTQAFGWMSFRGAWVEIVTASKQASSRGAGPPGTCVVLVQFEANGAACRTSLPAFYPALSLHVSNKWSFCPCTTTCRKPLTLPPSHPSRFPLVAYRVPPRPSRATTKHTMH